MAIEYKGDVGPVARFPVADVLTDEHPNAKYRRLGSLDRVSGLQTRVLEHMLECMSEIAPGRTDLLVDMKFFRYGDGDRLAPPGTGMWHTDVSLDPGCPDEQDHHLLWQIGDCGGFTQFYDAELIRSDVPQSAVDLDWAMIDCRSFMSAEPGVIYHYGPGQIHRAVAPEKPGFRMLIRLTATSRIQGYGMTR